jgi:hypothetical protein
LNPFDDRLREVAGAVARLRAGSGDAIDPSWRATVIESTAVILRGVAEVVESVNAPSAPPRDMNEDHLQAQRFARVRVAEMALYQASQVKAGRLARNLYGTLRIQIDEARTGFQQKFLTATSLTATSLTATTGIPDYLHQEMVLVLAQNDTSLLGPDYPGPLA